MEQNEMELENKNSLTVSEVENLCAAIAAQREVIADISSTRKEAEKKLDELELKMLAVLEQMGKTSYQSNVGTVYISPRTAVKMPASPEDREAFFNYLREKGIFESMITVHSQTLNSYYKEAFEEAVQNGDDGFHIPGLGEPVLSQSIGLRKTK